MALDTRLKREDCKRTKHDSNFSKWQVLIGPSDWQNYSLGNEGASRYRVHNLPTTCDPGLYELGIVVSRSKLSGRDVSKLVQDDIVVVYLGQADNVRSRLQQYGRSGAHLGNIYSTSHRIDSVKKGQGLFEEIFSGGHSIVFRWASMKDKMDAEKTEGRLLGTFDYAWNKGSNGARRPSDILKKLSKVTSSTTRFPTITQMLPFSSHGRVGIKIKGSKPLSPENCSGFSDEDSKNFFSGIFKFSRSQPRLVASKHGINEDFVHVCGFIMIDGIPCRMPPVPGRKRCEEHKGRKVYGSSNKSILEGNLHYPHGAKLDSRTHSDQEHGTICGLNLGDGTFCRRRAVVGRKRCKEHKGMQVNASISEPAAEDKIHMSAHSSVFSSFADSVNNNALSKHNVDNGWQCGSSSNPVKEHFSNICGVTLGNGSNCRRQPIQGNKRCWQHKGKRVDCTFSGVDSSMLRFDAPTCGVQLHNGSVCSRTPVHGMKRCEQHKGMRVSTSCHY